ncbi:MAG: tyrosine-protein phosphatase [Clostridia bacterium]|nr:tyrosine-protein phosphatase [Clostridia bacterium]
MKKFLAILAALCLLLSAFGVHAESMETPDEPLSVTLDVLNRGADAFFGCDVNISIKDFIALGFELGDACDVVLENNLYRYEFKSVPFYNGYYTKTGDPLLCAYGYAVRENRGEDYQYTRTDYPYLRFCFNNREMWNLLHLTTDMKCTITLIEQGGYEYQQKLVGGLTYSKDFEDYEAKNGISKEAVFANFRAVKSEAMKENVLFRSASLFDNANNRAPYVNALAKENGIDYVLNLADSQAKIDKYKEADVWPELDYSQQLLDSDQVCLMAMSAAYEGAGYQTALVKGLNSALEHNATKILFHCTEGKDRTGFVGLVLESLCGASYEEMLYDYMVTYDNYYSLTEASDKTAYDYIVDLKFNDMVNYLLTFDSSLEAQGDGTYDLAGVTPENFAAAARNLLSKAGMSEENLDALTALLKK